LDKIDNAKTMRSAGSHSETQQSLTSANPADLLKDEHKMISHASFQTHKVSIFLNILS